MISGARPGSIPDARLEPAPKLEVLLGHQSLALRRDGLGQVPEQELLSDGGGGKPDPRLHRGIEVGKLGTKPCLPDPLMHSDLLALILTSPTVMRPDGRPRKCRPAGA